MISAEQALLLRVAIDEAIAIAYGTSLPFAMVIANTVTEEVDVVGNLKDPPTIAQLLSDGVVVAKDQDASTAVYRKS